MDVPEYFHESILKQSKFVTVKVNGTGVALLSKFQIKFNFVFNPINYVVMDYFNSPFRFMATYGILQD